MEFTTRQSAFSILYAAIHDYRPDILKDYPRRPLPTYTDWCELCVIMEALEQEEDWWPVEIVIAMKLFDMSQLTDACDCDEDSVGDYLHGSKPIPQSFKKPLSNLMATKYHTLSGFNRNAR